MKIDRQKLKDEYVNLREDDGTVTRRVEWKGVTYYVKELKEFSNKKPIYKIGACK